MKNYFNNIEEHEKTQIANICKLVESKKLFIVASGAKYKILSRENESYTYDYTYNLIKWGFARKARNTDFFAQLHKYCPYQDFSATLAHFLNTAVISPFSSVNLISSYLPILNNSSLIIFNFAFGIFISPFCFSRYKDIRIQDTKRANTVVVVTAVIVVDNAPRRDATYILRILVSRSAPWRNQPPPFIKLVLV
jgi:hypothetical protein